MPGSVSIPSQQIWTGGSRNKTIPGVFLKSLKINTTIISCPNSFPGSSNYQRFLPRNLSAQKTAFVLLAQAISASTWTMNAQCLFPIAGNRLNTRLLANLPSLVPTRHLTSWTRPRQQASLIILLSCSLQWSTVWFWGQFDAQCMMAVA